jgi:hypothetical protein
LGGIKMNKEKENNQNNREHIQFILSSAMAGWLLYNRFKLLGTEPSEKNPGQVVFLFRSSPRLYTAMKNYVRCEEFEQKN